MENPARWPGRCSPCCALTRVAALGSGVRPMVVNVDLANLYDMHKKHTDVLTVAEVLGYCRSGLGLQLGSA